MIRVIESHCLRFHCALLLGISITCACATADQASWPRFRGPEGAGQALGDFPEKWTEKDYLWRIEVPGTGASSPVVWGDTVYITSADSETAEHYIQALEAATGKIRWKQSYQGHTYKMHKLNFYASATPVVDKDRLYVAWGSSTEFMVVALDRASGKELWTRNLGKYVSRYGHSSSPILVGGRLILANDQLGQCSVIALDPATGKTVWTVARTAGNRDAYSTPCVFQPEEGPAQVILTSTAHGITAINVTDGSQAWELDIFSACAVSSPLVVDNVIVASAGLAGSGREMYVIQPGIASKKQKARVLYEISGSLPYVVTPIAHGELLFLWSDNSVISCLEIKTGKLLWRERVDGEGGFYASPILSGDKIYCPSREGDMVVIAASRKFKHLGKTGLGEPCNSTPAVLDGRMFIRTNKHLMALGEK